MHRIYLILLGAVLSGPVAAGGEPSMQEWKTYQNTKFGYELSYPAEMEYVAYADGAAGELKDIRSGRMLVDFEVWPSDICPAQSAGIWAREIGVRRAQEVTQADGHGSSSYCREPVTVRNVPSPGANKIYELELTCISEVYPGSDGNATDTAPNAAVMDSKPIITKQGIKGPTYFVDISQTWRQRVLMADPAGVDPRINGDKDAAIVPILRKILSTLRTFPVEKPAGICMEDLRR